MLKRLALLVACAGLIPFPAAAQILPDDDVVDRVLAIVGDSAILKTQVDEEIQRMRLSQVPVPEVTDPEYAQFQREIIDNLVNRLLVIQAAVQDSLITTDDAAIDAQVSERIDQLAIQFGGQPALQEALSSEGLSLASYRDLLRNDARQGQIQQMFMQLRLRDARPVEVSEDEMLERFQLARQTLQQRPRMLTFRQVIVAPEPSEEAMATARDEGQGILDQIAAGEDFEELARTHSDDPGSAPLGGDLGWFRRGRMVEEFEDAAFSLLPGQVSRLVETDFGFHIIRIDRVRAGGGERQGRHILIAPDGGGADLQRARDMAAEVLTRAQSGESMAALAAEFSDPAAPDSLTLAFDQLADLPPAYAPLQTALAGALLGPLEYQPSAGDTRLAVVKVVEVREAGAYTFEDVRPQLASQLQQEKQLERIITQLREVTHIEIRM